MDRSIRPALSGALAAAMLLTGRLWAQERTTPKPLVMTAENLMAGDARHEEIAARHGDPRAVMPGDVVRYRLTFTNLRPDSVRNVQFNDPLPGGLHYVAGSASADRADVTVEFSIDSSRTWSAQPMVEEMVDGRKVHRPAPAATYTNVRWSVRGWLQPRAQVTAELKAQLSGGGSPP